MNLKYNFLGPFCGSDGLYNQFHSKTNQIVVVFYSDNRGARRLNGVVRAIVSAAGK